MLGEAYHFPKQYLTRVQQCIGDWIILYESGRNKGLNAYYAIQRVDKIVQDPIRSDHYYAMYQRGVSSRFDFIQPVPLKDMSEQYFEGASPAWQSAVRLISDDIFDRIVNAGTQSISDGFSMPSENLPSNEQPIGFAEPSAKFIHERETRDSILTSRKFRDPKFRELVVRTYQGRCAISGMELRNGGGRAEVQAAHIKSVEADGPDIIQNGIALSGTIHWMFDRKLLSIDEDHSILIAKDSIADDMIGRLINPERKLVVPSNPHFQPHPSFLKWHRENAFLG